MRAQISHLLDRPVTRHFIMGVILFNAVILGLETSGAVMARMGGLIVALDMICLSIFVVELLAKIYAQGPRFFRDGWNLFDFAIVGISLSPVGRGFQCSERSAFCDCSASFLSSQACAGWSRPLSSRCRGWPRCSF